MKDAENNAEKEETIQCERENGKKSNKYKQRGSKKQREGELGREEMQRKRKDWVHSES